MTSVSTDAPAVAPAERLAHRSERQRSRCAEYAVWMRVEVNRHGEVSAQRVGECGSELQFHVHVPVACQVDAIDPAVQRLPYGERDLQYAGLLRRAVRRMRAGIVSAMSGVDDDDRVPRT